MVNVSVKVPSFCSTEIVQIESDRYFFIFILYIIYILYFGNPQVDRNDRKVAHLEVFLVESIIYSIL